MASVPFSFECDKASGFVMDPNEHKCVGYITDFGGVGLSAPLAKDLTISLPYNNPAPAYKSIDLVQPSAAGHNTPATAHVVGVIEKFEWDGSVGGALKLDFWVSQENAFQIKALQQSTLKSTSINQLGWWIVDYDQETKQWYEKSYPQGSGQVSGQVSNRENPELNVDLKGELAKDGIDVMVYKISIQVAPGANREYALSVANSSTKPVSKQWGLIVGTLSASQYKNA